MTEDPIQKKIREAQQPEFSGTLSFHPRARVALEAHFRFEQENAVLRRTQNLDPVLKHHLRQP